MIDNRLIRELVANNTLPQLIASKGQAQVDYLRFKDTSTAPNWQKLITNLDAAILVKCEEK